MMKDNAQPDVKLRILYAAKKLFAKQGFDATTVRQICEEAGANVALVSYHFGGKENVFYAVFKNFFPSYRLAEYEEVFADPVEGIKLLIREVIRFRMEDPEMGRIMQQEIVMNSPRLETISSQIGPVWGTLARLLDTGKSLGRFRISSVRYTTLLIMGTLIFPNSVELHKEITLNEVRTFEQRVEDTVEFVLAGLGYRKEA